MTTKINSDTSDGLKITSDTSGILDIQSAGTTKMTVGTTIDIQGNELVLDADGDSSIHSSVDDQIDIKVGGSDSISITPSLITITDADSNQPRVLLKNTNADSTPPFLDFQKDSGSPADNDVIGKMRFIGDDDGGNTVAYATIVSKSSDVSDGTENGELSFQTIVDGTDATRIVLEHTGETSVFGRGGASAMIIDLKDTTGDIILLRNNGSTKGTISTNGSTVSYNTSSDYRLKENVDYSFDATARLKQLKPCRFNWIADDTNTLIDGFIAHEVSGVVPEAVQGEKDGAEMQGIDQSKLVPLLVKTIQELEARITALES